MAGWNVGNRRRVAGLTSALLALVCACAPPARGAEGNAPALLAVSALAGTVTQVDAGSGRVTSVLPAGPAPWQAVAGRWGSEERVLTLGLRAGALTLLSRRSPGGSWSSRAVALPAGAEAKLLAGGGGRYAVVAYAAPAEVRGETGSTSPCSLMLIDLLDGEPGPHLRVCGGAGETLRAIAVDHTAGATTDDLMVFAATYEPVAFAGRGTGATGAARVIATRMGPRGAALVARASLQGVPEQLVMAPAPDGAHRVLYAVSALPSAAASRDGAADGSALAAEAEEWRLTRLDVGTLAPEANQLLRHPPLWLSVTPDGRHAFAISGPTSLLLPSALLRLDLVDGASTVVGYAPGRAMGLAATGDRLYVVNPDGDALWVLDHRTRLVGSVGVGKGPVSVTLGVH